MVSHGYGFDDLSQCLHLVEVFHGLGEAMVDDKANVRLVDAESKRDGGNDRLVLPAEPLAVNLAARLRVESGMVPTHLQPTISVNKQTPVLLNKQSFLI